MEFSILHDFLALLFLSLRIKIIHKLSTNLNDYTTTVRTINFHFIRKFLKSDMVSQNGNGFEGKGVMISLISSQKPEPL